MADRRAVTIWIDVEDFLQYFVLNPRPSGIQRFSYELMRALLQEAGPERIRFVRRVIGREPPVYEVPWAEVEATFEQRSLAERREPADPQHERRRGLRLLVHALPSGISRPLLQLRTMQLRSRRAVTHRLPHPVAPGAAMRPGDVFLVIGSPWAVSGFAEVLAGLKQRQRLVTALLVHDLIPVRRPEWCGRESAAVFASFLADCLPLFDVVFANSRHTAADLDAYAAERGVRLARPVHPVPVGTSFGAAEPATPPTDSQSQGLPAAGSYVLVVSTLEPRKNHELAVRVWRRLVDEVQAGLRTPESVPSLVFAGRVGWLVGDMLQQLEHTRWLDGRVRLIRDPSDAELRQLYDGCLFTFVPSWFEGYGLPVTESLARGKPCLASASTAIPEAGGDLCRYIDPGDLPAAHRAVAALLDDRAALHEWQAQVRTGFRPTPWAETARAALAQLAG